MPCLTIQGCGLRKITRSPKPPYHEILGAQHLSLSEKSKFSQLPKGKVICLIFSSLRGFLSQYIKRKALDEIIPIIMKKLY